MNRLMKRAVPIATCVSLALLLVSASVSCETSDNVAWLEQHVIALEGCEAGQGFSDLEPLEAIIGDARIIGLGESTHGTREHFQMKHRLVEYLVEELGFTWFAIEASTPEAHLLDAYVLGGEGDPEELIKGMYFWTWTTEEVLAMVEWMRAYNARSDHKIHFTGFDMQTPNVAAAQVIRFLREVESPLTDRATEVYSEAIVAEVATTSATATYGLTADASRGKTIRFSAWIRTKDVHDGYAGLWCRIDGHEGTFFAFDNMYDRGLSGSTEWTECAIELPVDEEAYRIAFGFLLTGQGDAWFDAADITVGGVSLDTSQLDLGFEGGRIAGYCANVDNYSSRIDPTASYEGAQSLRITGIERNSEIPLVTDVLPEAETILADMGAAREAWLSLHSAEEVERALLNARIVVQYLRMKANPIAGSRDAAMADNVAWLAEQFPDERLVLWAHNAHISRAPGMMGAHLTDRFGDGYLPIGFATASGRYYAIGDQGQRLHDLQQPPAESFEATFAAATAPTFALDLRRANSEVAGSAWLTETRPFRLVGSVAMNEQFFPTPLRDYYDLIVFIEETTPARQF